MKLWLHKVERWVDWGIPILIFFLIFVLIGELFFRELVEPYRVYLNVFHATVIGFFVADVIFKYIRIKPFKAFLRESWLDIIAIFPFFLLFRLFEVVIGPLLIGRELTEAQALLRESIEIERQSGKIIKGAERATKIVVEAEKAGQLTRMAKFRYLIRPLSRVPRLLKAFTFYEKPTGTHHVHDRKTKRFK